LKIIDVKLFEDIYKSFDLVAIAELKKGIWAAPLKKKNI
jgi:hypothetical protein